MCTHGRIKKYTKMWVYGRYKAPAYPTQYPDKVHRHPSDTRFEKWKISHINIFHSLRFEFLVPRNTEEIHIQERKETKELDIQSRMLNA